MQFDRGLLFIQSNMCLNGLILLNLILKIRRKMAEEEQLNISQEIDDNDGDDLTKDEVRCSIQNETLMNIPHESGDSGSNKGGNDEPKVEVGLLYRYNAFTSLYLNEITSDITIRISSMGRKVSKSARKTAAIHRTFPAHKCILAAASSTFHHIFYGSSKKNDDSIRNDEEKDEDFYEYFGDDGELNIYETSSDCFEDFLGSIYIGDIQYSNLLPDIVKGIMSLAHRFEVQHCMVACVQYLKNATTPHDVFTTYELAILYNHAELKEFCVQKIQSNAQEVFKTDQFLNLDHTKLKQILQLDLKCEEAIIFDACFSWAKRKCGGICSTEKKGKKLKVELGECFHMIRFHRMTVEEVAIRTHDNDGLLTANEWADVIHSLAMKDYEPKIFRK